MLVADMMKPDGRVYVKSEFGPIGDDWPCFSFSKRSLGSRLRSEFEPGRDVIVYVGTTNPDRTEDHDHRSRLLSAVTVQPKQILETRRIVPAEQWRRTVERFGEAAWPHSMPVLDAALMDGPPFPHAHDIVPEAYASLANRENWGGVVEVHDAERGAVMTLSLSRIGLNLTEDVQRYMGLMASVHATLDKAVQREAARMAMLIDDRVRSGGEIGLKLSPTRYAPNVSDLIAVITDKWTHDQRGKCALCGGHLVPAARNPMLKASADRIDSLNPAYDRANTQITHLACNWAKNRCSGEEFAEWLAMVRASHADAAARGVEGQQRGEEVAD